MFVLAAVGYTMDTMYLSFLDDPIQFDEQIGVYSVNVVDTTVVDCSMNYTSGMTHFALLRHV